MSVRITGVEPDSLAQAAGVRPGEKLVAVNGHDIADVLDYRFYIVEPRIELLLEDADGVRRTVAVEQEEYDDPGLDFETYLMDAKRSCRNGCIFCFIDQLPKGMRESLYFKDDDARLSFLMGNYITLTNLTERDAERIAAMHISPINVSVHTTNPALRVKMMRNKRAGEALGLLGRFARAGIRLNVQLVLCPGVNDGAELDRSLADLGALHPSVESIAVVPVGLTRYREGLYPLRGYDRQGAVAVVDQVERFSDAFAREHGVRIGYAADEFYIKAGRPIPQADYYGEFSQLENGVGLVSLLRGEFSQALEDLRIGKLPAPRTVTLATGVSAAPFIGEMCAAAQRKVQNLRCRVVPVENRFFGPSINVSGLLTGGDVIGALRGRPLGDELLIPAVMLRQQRDIFLDDLTVQDMAQALHIRVRPVENNGDELLGALLGR